MHEANLMKKKVAAVPDGLVLAMDFEGSSFSDSVVTTRGFGGGAATAVLSPTQFKNGANSYLQSQPSSGTASYLNTPLSFDLTFPGDFWYECWGYCLGQGNPTYTASYNTILSFGSYQATGGLCRWLLNNLKPCLSTPTGTVEAILVTASTACTNNAWYHHALGRKNNTLYMFLNGAVVATATLNGTFGFGASMNIGGYADSRISGATYAGFNGYMDRWRVYNKCLYTTAFTPGAGLYPN